MDVPSKGVAQFKPGKAPKSPTFYGPAAEEAYLYTAARDTARQRGREATTALTCQPGHPMGAGHSGIVGQRVSKKRLRRLVDARSESGNEGSTARPLW